MLRRKLFAYTVVMTAGITAGFFMLERCEFVRGFMIMAAVGIPAALAEGPAFTDARKERITLLFMIAVGFLLFTYRFIYYESITVSEETAEVTGTVYSVKALDNGYELMIKNTDIKGIRKMQIRLYNHSYGVQTDDQASDFIPPELREMLGRRVNVTGRFSVFRPADNPGCFDNRLYMRSKGITCRLIAESISTDSEEINLYWKYRRSLIRERDRFLHLFENDEIRGFIRGVVFGDKSGIGEDIREEFSINSTGHILAVSGLHIGFLYALLRTLAGRRKNRVVSAVIILIIILYGEMTLWSAATVRAVMVMSISMLSFFVRRPADLLTSVSASAFMILLHEPYQLFDSGFQMSFTALLFIAFLAEPLKHFVGEYMSALIAVQTGVAPLGAFLFNRFNPLSLLINIPVVWLSSILVPFCLIMMIISLLLGAGSIPGLAVRMAEGMAEIVIKVNHLLVYHGFFSSRIVTVNAGIMAAGYLSILLLASEWNRVRLLRKDRESIAKAFVAVFFISAAIGAAAFNPFADDEIVFVAVGQGDCTHIRSGTHDIMIDGGGSTDYNVGKNTLMPYLLSNGTSDLDAAIVTHLHMDHYKGIRELCEVFPVGCIMIPDGYRTSIENDSVIIPVNVRFVESGSCIEIDKDVFIQPIWPIPGRIMEISEDEQNENNMVYMIYYKGIRIMVTGDLLEEDELEMVDYYRGTDTLRCDVLKVAHHGSKSSSSEEFLDAAEPSVAVIQVGKNNIYGHPHRQTLEHLDERGIRTYRTDINGAVGIDIHKKGWKIDLMK